jgi:hypothetical protein
MTPTQVFYQKLDTFLENKVEHGLLLKHENETISIDSKCEGGCIFSEFEFGILKDGEITIFWDSKPEFWKGSDPENFTPLWSEEMETEVKNQIRKYLNEEVNEGIEEDMEDLITSQKIEARKFRDSVN